MQHRFKKLCSLAAVAVAASALVACGEDGNDQSGSPAEDQAADDTDASPAGTAADAGADSSGADGEAVQPNGEVVAVKALDNTFIEEEITVAAGTEVLWENRGRNDHDVIPVDEGEDWGVEIEAFHPGDSYSHVFGEPGTYRYYCTIHGTADVGMIGTVVVT